MQSSRPSCRRVIRTPTPAELEQLDEECSQCATPELADNWRFWRLFNYEDGLICRELPQYQKNPDGTLVTEWIRGKPHLIQTGTRRVHLTRRQFTERYIKVRDIHSNVVPMLLNPAQRQREAAILAQERACVPVRQIDLKARQLGITTQSIAFGEDAFLRTKREKVLVVSQDNETAAHALDMTNVMQENLPRAGGKSWAFALTQDQAGFKTLDAPQRTSMRIASAKKDNPGRGFTFSIGIFDEFAFWEDAEEKARSTINSVPNIKGSVALVFSTANGTGGLFYTMFWKAWKQKSLPLRERTTAWNANFFAWFSNPGYRWSKTFGGGQSLPKSKSDEIHATLTEHEKWLLRTSYFQRWSPQDRWESVTENGSTRQRRIGVGWRKVDYDQLAWRRQMIADNHNGDPLRPETWADFQAEYPATPEEAFAATGRLVFDPTTVSHYQMNTRRPEFRGEIVDVSNADEVDGPRIPGALVRKAPFYSNPQDRAPETSNDDG